MERVIVAFEREDNGYRIKEILESSGAAACLLCRSAAEVRRMVRKQRIHTVICGFKLPDDSGEALREDLPQDCAMLMIADAARLELCGGAGIVKLAAPIKKSELLECVEALLRRPAVQVRPQRPAQERLLLERAKAVLMAQNGMTEEQAHRYLQKTSMDSGARLVDTARRVLEEQGDAPS